MSTVIWGTTRKTCSLVEKENTGRCCQWTLWSLLYRRFSEGFRRLQLYYCAVRYNQTRAQCEQSGSMETPCHSSLPMFFSEEVMTRVWRATQGTPAARGCDTGAENRTRESAHGKNQHPHRLFSYSKESMSWAPSALRQNLQSQMVSTIFWIFIQTYGVQPLTQQCQVHYSIMSLSAKPTGLLNTSSNGDSITSLGRTF